MTRLSFSDLGHVARDDALREPLDDRGLADARLADQHRVVLGAAREHLHRRGGSPRRGRSPGSSLPWRASSVRSRPNFSSAWYFASGSWSVTRALPRTACERLQERVARDAGLAQRARRRRRASSPASASSRCSVETYSSLSASASAKAASSTARRGARDAAAARRRSPCGSARARLERRCRARRSGRRASGASGRCCPRAGRAARAAGARARSRRARGPPRGTGPRASASWLLIVSLSNRMARNARHGPPADKRPDRADRGLAATSRAFSRFTARRARVAAPHQQQRALLRACAIALLELGDVGDRRRGPPRGSRRRGAGRPPRPGCRARPR